MIFPVLKKNLKWTKLNIENSKVINLSKKNSRIFIIFTKEENAFSCKKSSLLTVGGRLLTF